MKNGFNVRLKSVMDLRKISAFALSEKTDLDYHSICSWLKGSSYPRLPGLYKLCCALSISSDYLLGLCSESGELLVPLQEAVETQNKAVIHLPFSSTQELKKRIRESGIKQWQVAEEVGVSQGTLCVWLRGKLTQEQFDKIRTALDSLLG